MRSPMVLVCALVMSLPPGSALAEKVVVAKVETTVSATNPAYGLFEGKKWRAPVSDLLALWISFEAETPLRALEVQRCDPEDGMRVLAMIDGVQAVSEGKDRLRWMRPVKGWNIMLLLMPDSSADEVCLKKIGILRTLKEPYELVVAQPVAGKVEADRTLAGYPAMNLFDGRWEHAWSTKGDGTGAAIRFVFDQAQDISALRIANGYWRSEELWGKNGRPKDVVISAPGMELGRFTLRATQGDEDELLTLKQPLKTRELTLTVASTYKGKRYKDTVISELRFYDGERPFFIDPVPHFGVLAQQARKDFGRAGLGDAIDEEHVTDVEQAGRRWALTLHGDGSASLFADLTNPSAPFGYWGTLSWELKKTTKASARVRLFGNLTRMSLVSNVDGGKLDGPSTQTLTGTFELKPVEDGFVLRRLKGARGLPLDKARFNRR